MPYFYVVNLKCIKLNAIKRFFITYVNAGRRQRSAAMVSTQELIQYMERADEQLFHRETALRREEMDREDMRRENELAMRERENSTIVAVFADLVKAIREK